MEKEFYDLVKMFYAEAINEELNKNGYDVYDYLNIPGNDCAVLYSVDKRNETPLDEYLLNHGCEDEEYVWIDITW